MIKKVKFPLALKLVLLNTILATIGVVALTWLTTYFIRQDVRLTAEQSNHAINSQTATIAEYELNSMRDNTVVLVSALSVLGFDDPSVPYYIDLFYEANQNMAAMIVTGLIEFVNNDFFIENEIETSAIDDFLETASPFVERATNGEMIFLNATSTFGLPTIVLMLPWVDTNNPRALVSILSVEALTESFGSGTNISYMINDKNEVLIHSDFDLMYSAANTSQNPLVESMRAYNDENRQIAFTDDNGTEFLGAYTKLPFSDIAVITTIESSLVFEAVDTTLYQNVLLASAVLCILILFIRLFANTITRPVAILAEASEQIEQGNFSFELKARGGDEIGLLTARFDSMCRGLETFGRFVNLDVALQAMKGDLHLGGETKSITVLFSDIRNFTDISEKLEPAEVVEFLNEYMTRMVDCVKRAQGAVDKYIGDAIMAVWGASSTTGDEYEDALSAIRAAFFMRASLKEFNITRGVEGKPLIKIGCGINSGSAVAGQMGSLERMEYTVIGDTVNVASRTEMLTKEFCVDILIAENTYELVKEHITVEKMPAVRVKGKENPVVMYAVINIIGHSDIPETGENGPQSLQDLRAMLGVETPDLTKVNVSLEERKYKIEQ